MKYNLHVAKPILFHRPTDCRSLPSRDLSYLTLILSVIYHTVFLLYSYLESFERINFFGEDAEDVLAAGRPHTPVGGGTFPTHIPSVATTGTD